MFKVGDKVLFSLTNKGQFPIKSEIGIILKVTGDLYSILKVTKMDSYIYHNIHSERIDYIENRDKIENEMVSYYDKKIEESKNKLKSVTQDVKDIEKVKKYETLKQQIKATAKNLSESEDDLDFENKLKAICKLKNQIYTIELDCISDARKYNGVIWYEIKQLEKQKDRVLKDISEEMIAEVLKEL